MPELEFRYDNSSEYERLIHAFRSGVEVGFLNYGPEEDDPSMFSINMLRSYHPRQGVATALIREMVKILGPGVPISSVVIHQETNAILQAMSYFERARRFGSIQVEDPDLVHSLPIVRLINKGGINITSVKIFYAPYEEDNPCTVIVDGITEPFFK